MSYSNEIREAANDWWQNLIENDQCEEMERKHEIFGHDQGTNIDDICKMYVDEVSAILLEKYEKEVKETLIETKDSVNQSFNESIVIEALLEARACIEMHTNMNADCNRAVDLIDEAINSTK